VPSIEYRAASEQLAIAQCEPQYTGGGGTAFSIQVAVVVPRQVEQQGHVAVANWIKRQLHTGAADCTIMVGDNDAVDR
jgi:hypothetical protein